MPQEILSANVGTEETPEGENLNAETATQENAAGDASEPSPSVDDLQAQIETLNKQVERWKAHSREWEARAKKIHKSEDADDSVVARLEALQNEFSDYKTKARILMLSSTTLRMGFKSVAEDSQISTPSGSISNASGAVSNMSAEY